MITFIVFQFIVTLLFVWLARGFYVSPRILDALLFIRYASIAYFPSTDAAIAYIESRNYPKGCIVGMHTLGIVRDNLAIVYPVF